MADAEEKKQQETQEVKEGKENTKKEAGEKKSLVARFLPKVIIVVVLAIFAGAGLILGRFLKAGSLAPKTAGASEQGQPSQLENIDAKGPEAGSQKSWYYHLEPVIANLNVDDVTRYVKASLTLEISFEVDEKKGRAFIDEQKPILTNWLTVYLASLGLEDIRGDNNLKRIQSQVLDAFNEKLFPDSKPKIKNILFKEFAVQ
jgi:flagellar basal body-associated protein FliL